MSALSPIFTAVSYLRFPDLNSRIEVCFLSSEQNVFIYLFFFIYGYLTMLSVVQAL
jgi:hypothetical protein